MNNFEEYVYQRFADEIRTWPPEIAHDIYVIVIYITLLDDDSRFAELSLNYNTLTNWKKRISDTSDAMEAKWNYAFWPDDDKATLCKSPEHNSRRPDLKGIKLRGLYCLNMIFRMLNTMHYFMPKIRRHFMSMKMHLSMPLSTFVLLSSTAYIKMVS